MRAVSTLTAIGTALWFAASSAHALGFGRITNATQLGQPLNFAAAVRLDVDESLARECVSAEVQSGDNKLQPGQIRATLEGGLESAERSVRVTTSTVIDEPVVTVSVTLGCTARITRKFVAFIDPPLINLAQGGAAPAPETLSPQRNDTQVAPLLTLVEGEKPDVVAPRRPERSTATRVRPRTNVAPRAPVAPRLDVASGEAAASAPAPRPKSSTPRRSSQGVRVAAGPGGPRLKLETAPATAATPASAASSPLVVAVAALATAEATSAAAKVGEQAEQLAKERERIRVLEDGLNKLRAESQATQKAMATMQARLKDAESERYANPLIYGLAWLSALLALAVGWLLWRQSRARHSAQWWTAPAPTQAGPQQQPITSRVMAPNSIAGGLPSVSHSLDDPTTGAGAFDIPTVIEDDPPAPPPPLAHPPSFSPTASIPLLQAEPARELSVEELIDLEQQAEFFIVLGQDEAAIELLMSHVRSDGGISPLPYLKLLEIYRRRGETEPYERIRDRFNRRFNAYAPDWDSDLQQGRALVDYPDTITRLQALWATPTRVMETLDASLFRRNSTDETFDLPAYRELLFLYSISRDLAEHGGMSPMTDVDLLLPLSNDPNSEPISRLSATTGLGEFQNSDMMTMPLDLDISLDPPPANRAYEASETLPAALRRTPDQSFPADSGFLDFDLNEPFEPGKPSAKK
ncbi:MAG: hypothetical protein ABI887_07000 [Burkholderiales bacterium]